MAPAFGRPRPQVPSSPHQNPASCSSRCCGPHGSCPSRIRCPALHSVAFDDESNAVCRMKYDCYQYEEGCRELSLRTFISLPDVLFLPSRADTVSCAPASFNSATQNKHQKRRSKLVGLNCTGTLYTPVETDLCWHVSGNSGPRYLQALQHACTRTSMAGPNARFHWPIAAVLSAPTQRYMSATQHSPGETCNAPTLTYCQHRRE